MKKSFNLFVIALLVVSCNSVDWTLHQYEKAINKANVKNAKQLQEKVSLLDPTTFSYDQKERLRVLNLKCDTMLVRATIDSSINDFESVVLTNRITSFSDESLEAINTVTSAMCELESKITQYHDYLTYEQSERIRQIFASFQKQYEAQILDVVETSITNNNKDRAKLYLDLVATLEQCVGTANNPERYTSLKKEYQKKFAGARSAILAYLRHAYPGRGVQIEEMSDETNFPLMAGYLAMVENGMKTYKVYWVSFLRKNDYGAYIRDSEVMVYNKKKGIAMTFQTFKMSLIYNSSAL